jgi:hypothetical protein
MMKPAMRQRLHFIDVMLIHYGTINRGLICDFFALSQPQATLDLRQYFALAPGNADYDLGAKTYRRSATFIPLFQEDK